MRISSYSPLAHRDSVRTEDAGQVKHLSPLLKMQLQHFIQSVLIQLIPKEGGIIRSIRKKPVSKRSRIGNLVVTSLPQGAVFIRHIILQVEECWTLPVLHHSCNLSHIQR